MKRLIAAMALAALVSMNAYAMDADYHSAPTPEFTLSDSDFPILFEITLDMSTQCVGVGFDGAYIWVTSGDVVGACMFYIFDEYGNLIDEAEQGAGATGWGHRDLTWDGTYMIGSYDQNMDCYTDYNTFAGNWVGPLNPNRAMAFDGEYYYTCGYGESLMRGIWDGTFGSAPYFEDLGGPWDGAYGLAYDCFNDCLWMSISLASEPGILHKLTRDGFLLDTYSLLPEYGRQAACSMADTRFGQVLLVIQQDDPDMCTFYDVYSAPSPVEDATWGSIKGLFK